MKSALFVIAAHLVFVALLFYTQKEKLSLRPRQPIVVKTQLILPPTLPKPAPNPTFPEKKSEPLVVAAAKPEPIAQEVTTTPVKTVRPVKDRAKLSPKPSPKKTSNTQQEQLIALMQKTLTQLNSSVKKEVAPARGSASIGALASEQISFERAYEEELIAYLESLLALPQKGEVKVKLTLKRDGKAERVEIVNANGSENRTYIETHLATLPFPPFGSRFKGEGHHTFTLTLKSR